MNDKEIILEKIFKAFPTLQDSEIKVKEEIQKHAMIALIPKGEVVFFEGAECKNLALLLSGSVRVYKTAENGREITLYRLGAGESCVLTASCIFAHNSFPAVAVTEEEVEAAVIPSHVFREWIDCHAIWRNYVFNLLAKRLSSVIMTLEEVVFLRMDIRIAEFLIKLYGSGKVDVKITHQDIAMELGTSREVVSRILKNFESEKLISQKRGFITVHSIDSLKAKVESDK